jgi:hypothetical protein
MQISKDESEQELQRCESEWSQQQTEFQRQINTLTSTHWDRLEKLQNAMNEELAAYEEEKKNIEREFQEQASIKIRQINKLKLQLSRGQGDVPPVPPTRQSTGSSRPAMTTMALGEESRVIGEIAPKSHPKSQEGAAPQTSDHEKPSIRRSI